jgi:hypothetical protein
MEMPKTTKTTPGRPAPSFEVEWTSEAWTEVRALPPFERRSIMRAAAGLAGDAEVETGARNHLRAFAGGLPKATWEMRIRGGHRLLYCVADGVGEDSGRCVRILRLVSFARDDRRSASLGAPVSRAGAGELRRRAETLQRIGGGIPHEVVRRTWVLEMERAHRTVVHAGGSARKKQLGRRR